MKLRWLLRFDENEKILQVKIEEKWVDVPEEYFCYECEYGKCAKHPVEPREDGNK